MRRVVTYRLDGKVVNKETMIISLALRLVVFIVAIILFALATSFSMAESFALAGVLVLIETAKTLVVTVEDA